ncbi:DUF4198 domain-containing protein [Pararhodobacter sp.]|uniref:DUF4198 domain-containing protein n=1 Tax=Pararhodobacter sp. TaxID=2127056 RepID=UPI002AFFA638|nr:DUF4198 domain-containing protein [Pararhodobacter sp.]
MPTPIRVLLSLYLTLFTALPSAAHEFWIDPHDFSIATDEPLIADLRVGQNFEGTALSYIERNFTRFELAVGDSLQPVTGRLGDRPAVQIAAHPEGLGIVLYETTDSFVDYDDWSRFVSFVEHKAFPETLARHAERGLPETGFTEVYTRHVKSLIAIGAGAGQDHAFGLRTEFVALANPYTDDLSAGFPVQLLLDGAPRANVQVELWDRAPDDSVTVTVHHTDDTGQATLPVQPGHVYMVDAVTMLETDPLIAPRNAVWMSLWAALTFAVPAR